MYNTIMVPGRAYWSNAKPRTTWLGDAAEQATASHPVLKPTSNSGYQYHKWCTERMVEDKKEGYDYPVIRYAEVLLNYAEAVFERDGSISDADLDISLNLTRLRVNPNMPKLSNAFVSENDLDMREEIRRERTVELVDEAFRLDDLKRWKTAEVEMSQDLLGIKWTGTEYESTWAAMASSVKNDDGCLLLETGRQFLPKHYLYPIPTDQLKLNPNLKPNWQ